MKHPQHLMTATLLVILLSLNGCHLWNRTNTSSQLKSVHDAYRDDFLSNDFTNTLNQIQIFKETHKDQDAASKHVRVIEAMIYIQMKEFPQARAAANRASEIDASLMTSNGDEIRDGLFLQALTLKPRNMIDAYELIQTPKNAPITALQELSDELARISKSASSNNDGSIFIAAVSSQLRLAWHQRKILSLRPDETEKKVHQAAGQFIIETMGIHLSDAEKETTSEDLSTAPPSRQRYIRIYLDGKDLLEKAAQVSFLEGHSPIRLRPVKKSDFKKAA